MSESNIGSQQSATVLFELNQYCQSDSPSEEGIREIIARHGLTPNNHNRLSNYDFFYDACHHDEGIIRYLLEYFPDAAKDADGCGSPLHFACENENVTLSIIQLLIDAAPDSVRSVTYQGHMPLHVLCVSSVVGGVDEGTSIHILNLLIEKYPEAARHANNDGYLPIHLASRLRSPEFCRTLIEAYPGSERITDTYGKLPLHIACASNSLATVEYLHGLHPDIQATTKGWHPIHQAICGMKYRRNPATAVKIVQFLLDCDPDQKLKQLNGKSLLNFAFGLQYEDSNIDAGIQIIRHIYDAHPALVRSVNNNNGRMPLHYLCNNSKVDEAAATQMLMFLLDKHPEGIRHADTQGFLPIHIAAATKSPEFCRVLIEAFPGSEQITDANGALPLHYACRRGSSATVEYLYRLHPGVVTTQGFYPIHYAIMGIKRRKNPAAAAVEFVQFLLDCDPNQELIQFQGMSLLHYACAMDYNDSDIDAGIQIIKILFDANPEAIEDSNFVSNIIHYHQRIQAFINSQLVYARQAEDLRLMHTPDTNGRLPLHRALQNNVRLGSIKLLVKGNPSALRTLENSFALPLHLACQHHDSPSVIKYLLRIDEVALNAVDRQGNTALHYACRGAEHVTIALLLEKYDAAWVSKRNADDKFPINLLWESNAVEDRGSVEYMGSVFQLLKAYPEMIQLVN